jgi:hypothetical protein
MLTEKLLVDKAPAFTFSEEIDKIFPAFVSFQNKLGYAEKKVENSFFKSKYADISEVLKVIKEPLVNNKLAIMQFPTTLDFVDSTVKEQVLKQYSGQHGSWEKLVWTGKYKLIPVKEVQVTTLIIHESGQWIKSQYSEIPEDNSHHARGKAITYARRYCLNAICGIASEDEDGNPKVDKKNNGKTEAPKKASESPKKDSATSGQPTKPSYLLDSSGNKRYNVKGAKLDDEYQELNKLILTKDWQDICKLAKANLIAKNKIDTLMQWIKVHYGYPFFDLTKQNVDEVLDVLSNNPEIITADTKK